MIAIIDYGMGNLRSVQKGFEKMGYAAEVTRDAKRIEAAPGVILPGVGAFAACVNGLADCGLTDTVYRVVANGTPLSVRMAAGNPYSRNARSKIGRAVRLCVERSP